MALQDRSIERVGPNKPISVDCRVVAASKTNLLELSEKRCFAPISIIVWGVAFIELPPLRERREDIPLLFEHFTLDAARRFERDAPILTSRRCPSCWPIRGFAGGGGGGGTYGELRNVADRFRARRARRQDDQQARVWRVGCWSLPRQLENIERSINRGRAAARSRRRSGDRLQCLGIPKQTLYDKINAFP